MKTTIFAAATFALLLASTIQRGRRRKKRYLRLRTMWATRPTGSAYLGRNQGGKKVTLSYWLAGKPDTAKKS